MKIKIMSSQLIGSRSVVGGEVIELPDDRAKVLIERKYAEKYVEPTKEAVKPETTEKKGDSKPVETAVKKGK